MKKNIKKQPNKKIKKAPAKKAKASFKAKRKITVKKEKKTILKKKISPKPNKAKNVSKVKTKSFLKKRSKVVLKQKIKKTKLRSSIGRRKQDNHILTFGNLEPQHGKILLLVIAIILVVSALIVQNMRKVDVESYQPKVAGVETKRNVDREKVINNLVKGHPIEKMTPYIAKQDPKVAAFLIAIAKKESAWGEKKPVLNGEDCFNYWGFRLKSDRMGSGGHTCFDSPEEAVSIVGARINHLVNEEKIDTPKEMVIWKCGYGCDGPEAAGSQKWIKDVDYYYRQMIN